MRNIQTIIERCTEVKTGIPYLIPVVIFMLVSVMGGSVAADGSETEQPLYMKQDAPTGQRVEDLLDRMTLDEKDLLVHGDPSTGMDTAPVPRLGIPRLSMTDGPHGVRWGEATAFPTGVTLASTWNEQLLESVGAGLARETLAKGRNIILGPCINIHRVPMGGRNFESFSEDPFLAGRMAVGYIKGVQSLNVVATPKHFAVNNQEINRGSISVQIDERTLRELYLPQFRAAMQEGGAWSIMCSYNRINGVHACENRHLLTDILRNEWGFRGFVMSDWGAVHSTVPTVLSGMDIEMGSGKYLDDELIEAVRNGDVPESVLDNMVRRILRVMFTTGLFDQKIIVDGNWTDSPENRAVALDAAREGIVLLKNDNNLLPINRDEIHSLAVIGPNAAVARMGGGGSSEVTPTYGVSPLEGILKEAGDDVQVRYAPGCDVRVPVDFEVIPSTFLIPAGVNSGEHGLAADFFNSANVTGEPVLSRVYKQIDFNWKSESPDKKVNRDRFTIRWKGVLVPPVSGRYTFTAIGDGAAHLYIKGKAILHNYGTDNRKAKSGSVKLRAGRRYKIRFEYSDLGGPATVKLGWSRPDRSLIGEAAKLAGDSDAAVVVVGLDRSFEGEGHDRDNIELPGLQNDLIEAVAAANPNTIVVMINGTPLVINRWLDKVAALVEAWYPGEEGGRAVAEILFGDVNPSGKLPITYPRSWEQCPAFGNYPGSGKDGEVHFDEGIFVGYRYYDKQNIEPVFPFGYGLSYTSFKYDGLKIEPKNIGPGDKTVKVSLDVTNTGSRAGKEVVQLYVHDDEASVERPVRELKGIRKIALKPGETKNVVFEIGRAALSFYDADRMRWTAEPGLFEIQIGSSSRDIRLNGDLLLE